MRSRPVWTPRRQADRARAGTTRVQGSGRTDQRLPGDVVPAASPLHLPRRHPGPARSLGRRGRVPPPPPPGRSQGRRGLSGGERVPAGPSRSAAGHRRPPGGPGIEGLVRPGGRRRLLGAARVGVENSDRHACVLPSTAHSSNSSASSGDSPVSTTTVWSSNEHHSCNILSDRSRGHSFGSVYHPFSSSSKSSW